VKAKNVQPVPFEDAPTDRSESVLLQWIAPEYIKRQKTTAWFIGAGILVILLVLYAIWTNSWTMAVAFIVLAGVYALMHNHEPTQIEVKLTDIGVHVGHRLVPYNQIKAFWVVYHPPAVKVLKLLTTDKLMAELTIQLDGQAPGDVRRVLLKQVPEYEGRGESFVDTLIRTTKL
jgi:hypothetical protein